MATKDTGKMTIHQKTMWFKKASGKYCRFLDVNVKEMITRC